MVRIISPPLHTALGVLTPALYETGSDLGSKVGTISSSNKDLARLFHLNQKPVRS